MSAVPGSSGGTESQPGNLSSRIARSETENGRHGVRFRYVCVVGDVCECSFLANSYENTKKNLKISFHMMINFIS